MSFNGLEMNPFNLTRLSGAKSRSLSAENVNGQKNGGARATDGTGKACARELGVGWKVSPSVNVPAGETCTLADIEGPGMIQSMWLAGYVGREFIIRMYWDGQAQPSVEAPLSDFFGCGWVDNQDKPLDGPFWQLNSAMIAVNPNRAFNCFWQMPFRTHCRITLENRGACDHVCYYQINYQLSEIPDDCAYFHAQFRRTNPVPYMQDHVILAGVKGKGHYVGTALSVGLNSAHNWWGEGEVKFFLDGDEYPTICGTGTEDYFLGAYDWDVGGHYTPYNSLYGGMFYLQQPDMLYNCQQRFSMYRWHVMDPIRFDADLKVTIQDLGWRSHGRYLPRQDDFASVAYWYQTLPTAPFPQLGSMNDLEVI